MCEAMEQATNWESNMAKEQRNGAVFKITFMTCSVLMKVFADGKKHKVKGSSVGDCWEKLAFKQSY